MSHTYRLVVEFEADSLLSNLASDALVASVTYDIEKRVGATIRRCELGNGFYVSSYIANDAPKEVDALS